jgi:uncharacterized SAM-binding protein YcdF (DUF218 family)
MKKLKYTFIQYTMITAVSVWVILFLLFFLTTVYFKYAPLQQSDAIIVLTGGKDNRILQGIELLAQNYGQKLFISGVNKIVEPNEILKDAPDNLHPLIDLGYMAQDTHTNALEVSHWIQKNKIQTIILVTSFYHMPRSLLEIKKQLPNLKIIPHSIYPKQFDESTSWLHQRYSWHLFLEYHKFVATFFQHLIKG